MSELVTDGNAIARAAARLTETFSLWLRVSNNYLSADRQHVLLMTVYAIRQLADNLALVARCVDSETSRSADNLVALARGLSALVEPLHQELIATPPAPRPPSEPISAATGETP